MEELIIVPNLKLSHLSQDYSIDRAKHNFSIFRNFGFFFDREEKCLKRIKNRSLFFYF